MADEFDPLKQNNNESTDELYAKILKIPINKNNTQDNDLLDTPLEDILEPTNTQIDQNPVEERPNEQSYHRLDFKTNAYKAVVRPSNPSDDDIEESSQSINSSPPSSPLYANPSTPPLFNYSPPNFPHITSSSQSLQSKPVIFEQQQQQQRQAWNNSEHYHEIYEEKPPSNYYSDPYLQNSGIHRRKGITGALDRLVQRFPALGIFYRPSPPNPYDHYRTEQEQEYVGAGAVMYEESDEPPQLVEADLSARELTADELALNTRYSNKARTQIINLQRKDQTQPVDVCVHRENYTIYSCDSGRNVIEIFDMYGKLQHVIDDQTTLRFQPTSIAVNEEGTIILASHFTHRLQMYSPTDNNNTNYDGYHFKQYKLGSPGHSIHQFHFPAGLAIDFSDGYLYVCDRGNHRIQVLTPEGICERMIDLYINDGKDTRIAPIQIAHQQRGDQIVCIVGSGDGIFFIPKYANEPTYVEPFYVIDNDGIGLMGASGLAIDSNDRIFISDTGHHRIVICTRDGSYITHIGVEGNGIGELKRPCGLDITNDGTIVVADNGNKRLQLFGSVHEQTVEDNQSK